MHRNPIEDEGLQSSMSPAERTYLRSSVETAEPARLLVRLYDELRKQIRTVAATCAGRDAAAAEWSDGFQRLERCREIISYLIQCLNPADPRLMNDLLGLYFFCLREISQVMVDKDVERLDNILPVIEELREAWAQVASSKGHR